MRSQMSAARKEIYGKQTAPCRQETLLNMLEIWNENWKLDEQVCPCDIHFVEWLEAEKVSGKTIYHFGTGGHHHLGLSNMKRGTPNDIFGITASPKEFDDFVKLAIEHAELSRHYQVLFGDIYLLNPRLTPAIDIATVFHLCEFRTEKQDAYGALTDRQVAETLIDMLPVGAPLLFYSGSFAYWLADPIAKALATEGRLSHAATYKTLEIYRKLR